MGNAVGLHPAFAVERHTVRTTPRRHSCFLAGANRTAIPDAKSPHSSGLSTALRSEAESILQACQETNTPEGSMGAKNFEGWGSNGSTSWQRTLWTHLDGLTDLKPKVFSPSSGPGYMRKIAKRESHDAENSGPISGIHLAQNQDFGCQRTDIAGQKNDWTENLRSEVQKWSQ